MQNNHPHMRLIYEITRPHKAIDYDCPIQVYYESEIFNKNNESYFWVVNNGEYVSNYISFPCNIEESDIINIAKELIEELLSKSDFTDLDAELNGHAACEEFKYLYKSCDECPLLRANNKNEDDTGCFGAMYSIPGHLNSWDTKEKWNKIYGYQSYNHKKYVVKKMIGYMNRFMHDCGDSKEMINEVLEYGKTHRANKHKNLFK